MPVPAYLTQAIAYISDWLEHQKLIDPLTPGYEAAIAFQGDIVFSRAYGLANRERHEALTPAHLFRIASHSKTFTATAIMQLAEAGKLDIHAPAATYLPFLRDNPDPRVHAITVQQMLAHSAGIWRDGEDPSFWRLERPYPSREELRAFFTTYPLAIDANTRFKYSNHAYALLGWIIEDLSGLTYPDYMRQNILAPLGLEKIGGEYDAAAGPYITGYSGLTPAGEQIAISAALPTNDIAGATGFYANAESLCTFYSAVMPGSGKLLSDASKREMLRQQWQIPDLEAKSGYGLGFMYEESGGRILNGHSGGMPGNITKTLFDADEGIVISILTNSFTGKPDQLLKGCWHIIDFFKKHFTANAPYKKYAGFFYEFWTVIGCVPLGEKVYVSFPGQIEPFKDCSELTHKTGDTFTITKESGYGSYGQEAEFLVESGSLKGVRYAGMVRYNKEDFLEFAERLKSRNPDV